MTTIDEDALDGNAAAGAFGALFAADVTAAVVRCAACGEQGAFAALKAYLGGPGVVLRCRGCDEVMARLVRTPDSTWLELSGSTSWRLPHPT